MKKAILAISSACAALFIAISLCVAAVPASAGADNKSTVYKYLTQDIGFNSAAACGIMANIEKESGFNPRSVIRDRNGLQSGGLCMWNGSRFSNLKRFCSKNGYDYLSITGQIRFLEYELKNSLPSIYRKMMSVENTASGAYDAGYYWCYYFEIPSNRAQKAAQRGAAAKSSYWPKYSTVVTAPELSCSASGKTADCGESVKFTWTQSIPAPASYKLYITKPNGKTVVKSTKNKSCTVSLSGFGEGSYKAYVCAYSASGKLIAKKSNTVSFKAQCLSHDYAVKSRVAPKEHTCGKTVYKCTECTALKTVSVMSGAQKKLIKGKVQSLGVKKRTASSITLSWSSHSAAEGYKVYIKKNGEYKAVKTVSKTSCKLSGLKSAFSYDIGVKAYFKHDGKTYYSKLQKLSAATTPEKPTLTSALGGSGEVELKWSGVRRASGYEIYYCPDRSGDYVKLKTVPGGKSRIKIAGLSSSQYACFKVRAYFKTGEKKVYSKFSAAKQTAIQ